MTGASGREAASNDSQRDKPQAIAYRAYAEEVSQPLGQAKRPGSGRQERDRQHSGEQASLLCLSFSSKVLRASIYRLHACGSFQASQVRAYSV